MNRFSLASLFLHFLTFLPLLFIKSEKRKELEKYLETHSITEKELKQIISKKLKDQKQTQIVQTNKKFNKKPETLEKIYLGEKDNSVEKNQISKNNDTFTPGSSTSILTKGPGLGETKGKGVSAGDDFILGASIGPMTYLNTQEFKYFNYYNRIKEKVVENWRPLIRKAIKKVKANEKIYGKLSVGLKITKLAIKLDSKGEIIALDYVGVCGIEPFDLTAKKSFEISAPFASPPTELVQNGRFDLRWDFTVAVEESGLVEFKQ